MDITTRNLSKYIKEKGINLLKMPRDTGVPYMSLYDSLMNESRDRDLRAGEMFSFYSSESLGPFGYLNETLALERGSLLLRIFEHSLPLRALRFRSNT